MNWQGPSTLGRSGRDTGSQAPGHGTAPRVKPGWMGGAGQRQSISRAVHQARRGWGQSVGTARAAARPRLDPQGGRKVPAGGRLVAAVPDLGGSGAVGAASWGPPL